MKKTLQTIATLFDYAAMFKHSTPFYDLNPFYDPKRPHPIESYRSQQRKAKQRNKSKKYA